MGMHSMHFLPFGTHSRHLLDSECGLFKDKNSFHSGTHFAWTNGKANLASSHRLLLLSRRPLDLNDPLSIGSHCSVNLSIDLLNCQWSANTAKGLIRGRGKVVH